MSMQTSTPREPIIHPKRVRVKIVKSWKHRTKRCSQNRIVVMS